MPRVEMQQSSQKLLQATIVDRDLAPAVSVLKHSLLHMRCISRLGLLVFDLVRIVLFPFAVFPHFGDNDSYARFGTALVQ